MKNAAYRVGGTVAAANSALRLRLCEGLMALHFRPKPVLLLGFVIGSKFIPQPAFCKTACYV